MWHIYINKKGERDSYILYRGIFRATVFSDILNKLIHNDEYKAINKNLMDGNVWSRKRRNVRDNLFVIAVMNAAKQSKTETIDINVYDVQKCFDTMWL